MESKYQSFFINRRISQNKIKENVFDCTVVIHQTLEFVYGKDKVKELVLLNKLWEIFNFLS